jgi:hypothetical protein
VVAQFASEENTINVAGVGLTSGLDALHPVPTVAELAAVDSPYETALQTYSSELAAIKWPKPQVAASGALRVRVAALTSFLQTLQGVQGDGLGAWLVQFHVRAEAMTAATTKLDNKLGLLG